MTKRVAIFISGGGSNMRALALDMTGDHPARPALVLSNNADAGGIVWARQRGLATAIVDHRAHGTDRAAFDAAGGFPDIPLMEDVALARALKRRIALMPLAVTTASDRYVRAGWLRRGARNLSLLLRYLAILSLLSLVLSFFPFSGIELAFSLWSLIVLYLLASILVKWQHLRKLLAAHPQQLYSYIRKAALMMLSIGMVLYMLAYFVR